jgi:hypothetical protein
MWMQHIIVFTLTPRKHQIYGLSGRTIYEQLWYGNTSLINSTEITWRNAVCLWLSAEHDKCEISSQIATASNWLPGNRLQQLHQSGLKHCSEADILAVGTFCADWSASFDRETAWVLGQIANKWWRWEQHTGASPQLAVCYYRGVQCFTHTQPTVHSVEVCVCFCHFSSFKCYGTRRCFIATAF